MSSSDDDAVRRPGRIAGNGRVQSPSGSDRSRRSPEENVAVESPLASDADPVDGGDDGDLFGSDGSDGEVDNLK